MVHHVRGEKVVFGKGDFHHLDAMPSCDHGEAMVLAPARRKSWTMRFVKLFFLLFFLAVLGIGGLWVALENGSLDEMLTTQAEAAMATESLVRKAILAGTDPQEAYLRYGKF